MPWLDILENSLLIWCSSGLKGGWIAAQTSKGPSKKDAFFVKTGLPIPVF